MASEKKGMTDNPFLKFKAPQGGDVFWMACDSPTQTALWCSHGLVHIFFFYLEDRLTTLSETRVVTLIGQWQRTLGSHRV